MLAIIPVGPLHPELVPVGVAIALASLLVARSVRRPGLAPSVAAVGALVAVVVVDPGARQVLPWGATPVWLRAGFVLLVLAMAILGRVAAAATPWWVPVALAVGMAGAAWASAPDTEATIVGAAALLPVLAVAASLGWSTPAGWSSALPALAFAVTASTRGRPSSFVAIACSAAVLVVGTALAGRQRRHRVVAQVVAVVDALVLDAVVARTLGVEPGLVGAGRAVLWASAAVATVAIVAAIATRPLDLDGRARPRRRCAIKFAGGGGRRSGG